MKDRFVLATLVSVILAAACLPITDKADGSSCSDDGDCKSGRCHDGFCAGRKCTPGDDSSCDDGWKCTHNKPDAITGFFGASGSDTCKPTCPNCPGNAHCAKDAPPGALCSFGKAPLDLSVSVENGIIGRSAKLTAKAANGGRITKCKWNAGDGKPEEETPGPTLERTFSEARQYRLELSCDDESGAHGFLQSSFEITCTPSGESCVAKACCADETMRCVTGTCRVPAPPVLEITGPTTVPAYESGSTP
jgi:hypothetical protein